MSIRHDFNHDVGPSATEHRLQQEALAQLRARKAAQAVLDREAAAKDAEARWVRQQVAASRPAPVVGVQQAARNAMMARTSPGWTLEPPADPQRLAAAMRMDGKPASAGVRSAAGARELMMRRLGGR